MMFFQIVGANFVGLIPRTFTVSQLRLTPVGDAACSCLWELQQDMSCARAGWFHNTN